MKHGDRLQPVGSTTARRNHHSRCFPVLSCPVPAVTGYCTGPTTTSTVTPTGDCAAAPLLLICSPSVPIRSRGWGRGFSLTFPPQTFSPLFFPIPARKYNRRLLVLLLLLLFVFAITAFGRLRRQSQSFLVLFFLRFCCEHEWKWSGHESRAVFAHLFFSFSFFLVIIFRFFFLLDCFFLFFNPFFGLLWWVLSRRQAAAVCWPWIARCLCVDQPIDQFFWISSLLTPPACKNISSCVHGEEEREIAAVVVDMGWRRREAMEKARLRTILSLFVFWLPQ